MAPLVVAGFVVLWRTAELRFIAVAATLVVVYVVAWVPGKVYYADGVAAVVLAAGAAARALDRTRRATGMAAPACRGRVARRRGRDPSRPPAHPAGQRGALPPGLVAGQLSRRLHRLAAAHPGGRGTGRRPGSSRAGAHRHLHRVLRRGRHPCCLWRRRPLATGALRQQRLLDVGTWASRRPQRAGRRRAQPTAAVLRQLPPAEHRQPAIPGSQ